MCLRQIVLLIGFFYLPFNLSAQVDSLIIKGHLRLLVGSEITIPKEVSIDINHYFRFELSDSLGNFTFYNLKPGNYKLIARGLGYETLDTMIVLGNQSLSKINLLMKTKCDVDSAIAEKDIIKKKPRLLLIGSIAPIFYKNQNIFERKFHIIYHDYGDNPPAIECVVQYNKRIFEYLDLKFGKIWRQEVRQDVIGL
jgi:hypothetical protein